ncbi:metal-dependent hydrolase [Actinoplanes sp. SE50]|uniref:MBL fold metallo-hydrolase n=1 Tax=unclassified Actinoplanes TaxID=2626549 RepID=UPI00023ED12C|nr:MULTISPECIES: MBL fold metallo-hydrolase [unclassified Actinoplanes]AEV87271.1 metal-dependent hydrolase [Actinoplanes sp. SE50/110]ATO85671.1 metal-dependent hydrolase [Actinoplanes sp. SE50]SLM03084.1 metal-dependent hydrolase [Actinoplanes sp. SE50/110]
MTPQATVTFIGNATTLLRLGEFTLLTDPAFGHAGSRVHLGYGMWTRRLIDPAMRFADLPPLDAVLLSHLHGDHFDRAARRSVPRDLPILTTPQAERRLRRRHWDAARGIPVWDATEWQRAGQTLRITALPGRHGPGFVDRLLPDVMGSLIEWERDGEPLTRIYITGDTLHRPFLSEIRERCGEIDAMLIHLGGTRILGLLVTMDGRQGAALTGLIRPKVALPIHYDDYRVMKSPLSDYLRRCRENVHPLRRGETYDLPLRVR